jgi:glycine C-acetyltransferase
MTIPDVAACIKAVEILSSSDELVKRLWSNTNYFKKNIIKLGFDIGKSQTPIAPIMLGDEKLATNFSQKLFNCGIFAKAITYPTVGHGKARIRIMNSASHSRKDLDTTLEAFKKVGKSLKVI